MKLLPMMLVFVTACAMDLPESEQTSELTANPLNGRFCSDTGVPTRCDGGTQAEQDFWCNLACIDNGDVGGYCWHNNNNDVFHGICVAGFGNPIAPNPTSAASRSMP